MSAIAGLVATPPFLAGPRVAETMLSAVHAPSSDPIDAWHEGPVAMGARGRTRWNGLHVDAWTIAVCDARIENRPELCAALGLHLSSTTDAAIIARSFRRWGRACPAHLKGEFAFAVWDCRSNVLFAARDRFGVRPFYYRATEPSFRFGTTPSALCVDDGLAAQAEDETWIVDFAAGVLGDTSYTPYRTIRRLPPAHCLTLESGAITISRYWSFDEVSAIEPDLSPEALAEALSSSVADRLPQGRAAAFLSGGLDSSSICCLARRALQDRAPPDLSSFSIVFDETPEESERPYMEAVLADGGISPTFVNVPDYRPLSALPRLMAIQSGPFLAPGLPLMDQGYKAVAEHGFDAVLDGHGGDEVISSGLGRLHELARSSSWLRLYREIAGIARRQNQNPLSIFASYVGYHGKGLGARVSRRLLASRKTPVLPSSPAWLAEQWRDETTTHRHGQQRRSDAKYFASDRDHHIAQLSGPLQGYGFEVISHLTRAHGIESRFPFWDQRVVELCLRFPASAKIGDGHTRALLRSAMKGTLPEMVRQRPDKLDFSVHFVRGLRRDIRRLREIEGDDTAVLGRFIDRGAFSAFASQLDDPSPVQRAAAAGALWRGAALAMWFEARRSTAAPKHAPLEGRA